MEQLYDNFMLLKWLRSICWALFPDRASKTKFLSFKKYCNTLILLLFKFRVGSTVSSSTRYLVGHSNPSIMIIGLDSPTTYVVCVNFINKLLNLRFKFDSERQIFWEVLSKICWEEVSEEILFVSYFDVWPGVRFLLYHGGLYRDRIAIK